MKQIELAHVAGISQPRVSELERGHGASASIETWARAAAAAGEQLVGFLELAPGTTPPRDIEHLRRQAALIDIAKRGGWRAHPEFAIDTGIARSRSVDVVLIRRETREAALVEIWNWFDDVGAALRSLDGKGVALTRRLSAPGSGREEVGWTVRGLFIVRRTRRNERLVRELRPLFAARFEGRSRAWLAALQDRAVRLPNADGFLWSTGSAGLQASRLR